MEKSLYFIAVVPDNAIRKEVTAIKEYFSVNHDSKQALKSPPHITLYMPFKWRSDREEQLINSLQDFARGRESFEIGLRDFGNFKPRVIFIAIEESKLLAQLYAELKLFVRSNLKLFDAGKKANEFHPHMTVAFRDLRKSEYFQAWEKFENERFEAKFNCHSITLLKHNGKSWDTFQELKF